VDGKSEELKLTDRIDTYQKFKGCIVEPDFDDFMKDKGNLRKAWHCAGSLFHLADWVYGKHKPSIDAKYQYLDDNGTTKSVSRVEEFATALGQKYPDFQLVRGVANAAKHFALKPVPAGRVNPAGMPSHAANTHVSGTAFQPNAFQTNAFQTGSVYLQATPQDIEFAPVAQSVLDMWNKLFTAEGW
jgi:hypothetical protein